MKGLITAAGRGTRMQVPANTNKCLLQVGHKSIIEHSIESLQSKGIDDIYVITGQACDEMKRVVGDTAHCVYNPEYATKGIIVSIYAAREALYGEPFVLVTGDLYYDRDMIDSCKSYDGDLVITYEIKDEYVPEDSKVSIMDGKIVKMGKELTTEETSGEFGHMMKVSAAGSKLFFDKIKEHIDAGDTNVYLMDVINALIDDGVHVVPVNITGFSRIEIDFPEELSRARETIYPKVMAKNGSVE